MQTTLARIMEEYERIAFGDDEDIKITDRLRALEQLAQVAGEDTQDLEAFLQALQGESE